MTSDDTREGAMRILLAAGGTGGHLFPAYALAEELQRRDAIVDLITDMRGDRYGTGFPARKIHQVPSATLASKSPLDMAKTSVQLARGVSAAYVLLGDIAPHAVIGFGGYPTFPPLVAAGLRGIPTAVHEQNAVLGRANKMLARRVTKIATSFETTKFLEGPLLKKAVLTGNPVRHVVMGAAEKPYRVPREDEPIHILVFGGSQGARFFADCVPEALASLPDAYRARLRIAQQARAEDVDRVTAAYEAAGITAAVAPFFPDLPARMADSCLVIARSGASTVAELTVIGRPAILVPLPHAIDNDQLNNAMRLHDVGGGWFVEQQALSPQRLADDILRLVAAPDALAAAARAAKTAGRPDAVQRLADLVLNLAAGGAASRATAKPTAAA